MGPRGPEVLISLVGVLRVRITFIQKYLPRKHQQQLGGARGRANMLKIRVVLVDMRMQARYVMAPMEKSLLVMMANILKH